MVELTIIIIIIYSPERHQDCVRIVTFPAAVGSAREKCDIVTDLVTSTALQQ